jgi:hypothetical protein
VVLDGVAALVGGNTDGGNGGGAVYAVRQAQHLFVGGIVVCEPAADAVNADIVDAGAVENVGGYGFGGETPAASDAAEALEGAVYLAGGNGADGCADQNKKIGAVEVHESVSVYIRILFEGNTISILCKGTSAMQLYPGYGDLDGKVNTKTQQNI